MKERVIGAGLSFFRATGLDRAVSVLTRGRGVVLMFHNVRPASGKAFAPNQALEVTPEFFDAALTLVANRGYEFISVGELSERLMRPDARRFCVVTFDDGYRDNLEIAAPILRRHNAPYVIYVTTGFAARAARLWWLELEAAIGALDEIDLTVSGERLQAPARSVEEKRRAYRASFDFLRAHEESAMLDCLAQLVERARVDVNVADLCMSWDEIRAAADDPLCTIGAHTLTHARLAMHEDAVVRRELEESRAIIEREIGRSVAHLAYPFGDEGSAGPREFAIARACGYETAVTTRPGVLFAGHSGRLFALPRLAVHGDWQDIRFLDALLTGAPFALWNLGRRINVRRPAPVRRRGRLPST